MHKDKTMEAQLITIPIVTDMDTAQLLDIINTQISQMLEDEIESYGYEAEVNEDEICVEILDELD
tara:strand:- start:47 stop:241 length:195 start_codon:yes stop_codon:yes gene_type:complete